MPHYAHMVSVSRLQVHAHLGFYTGERANPQPVEISFRLYYPEAPEHTKDDEAQFIDYGQLSKGLTDLIAAKSFKLIEFMGAELYRHLRADLDARGATQVRVWLQMNKIAAPLPGLIGGASYTHCDLEPGATVAVHV